MKILITGLLFCSSVLAFAQDSTAIGKVIPPIVVRNVDGQMVSFETYQNARGFMVVFTCNHCPMAKLYSDRLNELSQRYTKLDVPLLAINSMDTTVYEDESFQLMKDRAAKVGFTFPYLYDDQQSIGLAFGAEHTPQAFVVWKESGSWVVRYSGAIDDNGQEPEKATPFLAQAVDDLLNDKPVADSVTESFGCRIFYRN